jgi:hypothetical protein
VFTEVLPGNALIKSVTISSSDLIHISEQQIDTSGLYLGIARLECRPGRVPTQGYMSFVIPSRRIRGGVPEIKLRSFPSTLFHFLCLLITLILNVM